ncbi:hypothetical protein [Pontivivens nitratireducens]|uniref:hypothetical protein n=1 Tax=Pontivivens nitratireducens TaxID=2758038 RepID=UPI00163B020C|nr:hypothetical protein [Pontibrevibacter nitratireducens]
MKIEPKSAFVEENSHVSSPEPILLFISAHYEGLWYATHRLGGCETARLVDRCVELLLRDRCLTRRTRIMLKQILDVISLENVDDPALPYMEHFAAIDPLDPVVEEICLLSDGLRHAFEGSNATITREAMA